MDRGPAAYILGPPPSRGGDFELDGEVYFVITSGKSSKTCFFHVLCLLFLPLNLVEELYSYLLPKNTLAQIFCVQKYLGTNF